MAVFSIAAFFIVLREVLEACLVVGIALAYVNKTGATQYKRWVWLGAIAGIIASIIIGVAFIIVYYVSDNQLFKGKSEKIFEGVTFLLAAALLSTMIIWMMYMGKALRENIEKNLDKIVENEDTSTGRKKASMFAMIFFQVFREGIETIIFLFGTASADDVGGWRAIPLSGILAIIVGLAISYLVFKGLVELDITKFFLYSGIVLIAFAAGLVSHAFHELQEVDLFGTWEVEEPEVRDWYNTKMWSTKECCNDKTNQFFAMLRALFGYQDTPTFVEWVTYFAYWLIIVGIFIAINWAYIRSSREGVLSQAKTFNGYALLFTFVAWIFTLINVSWIGTTTMTLALILSVISVVVLFDAPMRLLKPLMKARRSIVLFTGISWALLTLFMIILHFVQLGCEGTERCTLDKFYFFGLIFSDLFNNRGREKNSWVSLAVLSWSLVITLFFFGALSFFTIITSFNYTADGSYVDNDGIQLKNMDDDDATEQVMQEEPELQSEPAAVTA